MDVIGKDRKSSETDAERPFYLKEGERLDDLQRGGFFLIQNPKKFCFGIDAVLLSSFACVQEGELAMDLCCGNGAIPMLLAGKTKGKSFHGLEIQEESADMAIRSVAYNKLEERIRIFKGDIRETRELLKPASYHVVTANPPYMPKGSGIVNPQDAKAIARHEVLCDFQDVAAAAAYLLKENGRFYLVHRPFRLVDLMCTLREKGLEPKRMRLVQSYQGKEPTLVLLECMKSGRVQLNIEPGLVIYQEPGKYTPELLEMYY